MGTFLKKKSEKFNLMPDVISTEVNDQLTYVRKRIIFNNRLLLFTFTFYSLKIRLQRTSLQLYKVKQQNYLH